MTTLTLGISPCPNDVFIFSGLLLGKIDTSGLRFKVDFQDVEALNQKAQGNALDIAKISYANYVHIESDYELLDCGGALGRGVGPLLLSNNGAWNPNAEVLVPGQYTTANFLLDFYAQSQLHKRFLPFDALYEELRTRPNTQGVVIHEKRFTFARDGLDLIVDLGQHWEERTGFSIPLGAIAVRRSLNMKTELEQITRDSLQWAYAHYEAAFALCREHAADLTEGVVQAHIGLYVNDYSVDLGAEGRKTVAFFLAQQRKFMAGA